jgi:hypothetical protein
VEGQYQRAIEESPKVVETYRFLFRLFPNNLDYGVLFDSGPGNPQKESTPEVGHVDVTKITYELGEGGMICCSGATSTSFSLKSRDNIDDSLLPRFIFASFRLRHPAEC